MEQVENLTAAELLHQHTEDLVNKFRESQVFSQERQLFESFVFLYLNSTEGAPMPERVEEACRIAKLSVAKFLNGEAELVKELTNAESDAKK